MPDTMTAIEDVTEDTSVPLRLTAAAVGRAKRRFHARNYDEVAAHLKLSRSHFYRLLAGTHDIRLSRAADIADRLDWPLSRVFERPEA